MRARTLTRELREIANVFCLEFGLPFCVRHDGVIFTRSVVRRQSRFSARFYTRVSEGICERELFRGGARARHVTHAASAQFSFPQLSFSAFLSRWAQFGRCKCGTTIRGLRRRGSSRAFWSKTFRRALAPSSSRTSGSPSRRTTEKWREKSSPPTPPCLPTSSSRPKVNSSGREVGGEHAERKARGKIGEGRGGG